MPRRYLHGMTVAVTNTPPTCATGLAAVSFKAGAMKPWNSEREQFHVDGEETECSGYSSSAKEELPSIPESHGSSR